MLLTRDCLLAGCLVVAALAAGPDRRHIWADCVQPPSGDTNTRFYFYANTNHPSVQSTWSLVIAGATNLTLLPANGSFTPAPQGCAGAQPYW